MNNLLQQGVYVTALKNAMVLKKSSIDPAIINVPVMFSGPYQHREAIRGKCDISTNLLIVSHHHFN